MSIEGASTWVVALDGLLSILDTLFQSMYIRNTVLALFKEMRPYRRQSTTRDPKSNFPLPLGSMENHTVYVSSGCICIGSAELYEQAVCVQAAGEASCKSCKILALTL